MEWYTDRDKGRNREELELFFNELSIEGKERIEMDSVLTFAKVYRALSKYEVTTCRIDPKDNAKLHRMIQSMPNDFNIRNFYFSFFRSPYESEIVEEKQEEYLKHEWICNGKRCIGLPLALILNSAVLSIYESECDWTDAFICITKDDETKDVRNISTEQHVVIHIPQIQTCENVELVECDLNIEDKRISLRDDHGKDILMDFSKRLIRCPYVEGVVNSLPFNSHERKFIKRILVDGLIEIVLPWTDKGYGIVVKTTGRTLKETELIGKIIAENYGRLS